MDTTKPRILLHVCCATCTPYVLKLLAKDFTPTIYYYNPNIHPYEEYQKRKLDVEGYVRSLGFDFIEGEYDPDRWRYVTKGLETEPEGGVRCEICFKVRMNQIALYSVLNGFEWFATTLTVSPHKNSHLINRICQDLAKDYKINFYQADFKKHEGYKISLQMAKNLDFYRQNYCGCYYSLKQTEERKRTSEEVSRQSQQIVSPTN